MNFCSDNVATVAPEVMASLQAANQGPAAAYGDDPLTRRVQRRLQELFETDCAVFLVATGTAANSLALAQMTPPYGAVFCHEASHINVDECGGPEFYSGGAKLIGLPGAHGKIVPATLTAALAQSGGGAVHHTPPAALSLTNATESGAIYTPAEMAALCGVARGAGLKVHVDGARFANAVAALGCRPADLSWRAGVAALSFGATKNGCLAAEAVLLFDPALCAGLGYRRKRAGHLWSKSRYLAAQWDAYLADELWLRNARHANAMARRLADGLALLPGTERHHPVEANEVFISLPPGVRDGLCADGFRFYQWPLDGPDAIRLVTAFDTDPRDVEAFIAAAQRHTTIAHRRRA